MNPAGQEEEIGLKGAFALDGSLLKGRTMLNLDTEEAGQIYIGCAGLPAPPLSGSPLCARWCWRCISCLTTKASLRAGELLRCCPAGIGGGDSEVVVPVDMEAAPAGAVLLQVQLLRLTCSQMAHVHA